jgi:hypothetical protein
MHVLVRGGAWILASGLVLCACTSDTGKAGPPEAALVGMPKTKILACAGQPMSTSTAADREYLTYRVERLAGEGYLQSIPRIPGIGSVGMGGKGRLVSCEVTVVIKGGAVEAASFRTDPALDAKATSELCTPLVRACLPR